MLFLKYKNLMYIHMYQIIGMEITLLQWIFMVVRSKVDFIGLSGYYYRFHHDVIHMQLISSL